MGKLSFKKFLEDKKIQEIDLIINKFSELSELSLKYNNLKKSQKIALFINNLDNYLENLVKIFSEDEYKVFKLLSKRKSYKKSLLSETEINILEILKVYNLAYIETKKNEEYYYIYPDIKKMLFKTINKNNYKYILLWKDKINFVRGIINVFGIVSFDDLFLIYTKNYSETKEQLLKVLNKQISIHKYYKIGEIKKKIYIYNYNFSSLKLAEEFINENDLDKYGYLTYIEYGNRTFKYNKEYKRLIKLIKRNYVYKKTDLMKFINISLNKYVDLYQIDVDMAQKFLKKCLKDKFEFKNDELESKLMIQIEKLAKEEPRWVRR